MSSYALTHISDEDLIADLGALVERDRRTTAALLAHLAEVDARELFLPAACSSMHVYCVRVLRLADEVAYKRIRAARAARTFPQIFDAIADGRLHVTGVVLLAPHLTDENVDAVLASAAYRSKAELEMLVARLDPKPDVPTFIEPLDLTETREIQPDPDPVAAPAVLHLDPDPVPQGPESVSHLQALAPGRFALQCTISEETRDKLEWLVAMTSHANRSGDLGEVIGRACDALIKVVERERFAVTERPRAKGARTESDDSTYVPADVKRAVYERDGGRCTFASECGERCGERRYLQIDHIVPRALGGKPTEGNLRLLCGPHNLHEANRKLGADFMAAKRAQAKAAMKSPGTSVAAQPATASARATAPATPTNAGTAINAATDAATDAATATDVANAGDAELVDALTSLGYTHAEARRGVFKSAGTTADTFEGRLRAALAALSRSHPIRCSDGAFDVAIGWPLWVALQPD